MTALPRAARFGANAWTGGQYSIARLVLGAYLCVHFVHLAPWGAEVFSAAGVLPGASLSPLIRAFPNILGAWDSPGFVTGLLVVGAMASVALGVGWFDRVAAVLAWYILACLYGRNPLIANPSLPCIGFLLLMHACLPGRPYGSVGAISRTDPGGGWRFTPAIYGALWVVMAIAYTYSGWTKLVSPSWVDGSALARVLENPLARPTLVRDALLSLPGWMLRAAAWASLAAELAFAPMALWRTTRILAWAILLMMHAGLMVVIDFADLSFAMIVVHLFMFDPGWIPGARRGERPILFYDGSCGLCHRFVRLVLAEDREGRYRFSPLSSGTAARLFPHGPPGGGDSLVLSVEGRPARTRTDATVGVLASLGGLWRVAGAGLRLVPRPVRDAGYAAVARVRHRLFARPADACPMIPPALRDRFVA